MGHRDRARSKPNSRQREEGYRQAALAHLTLLLIDVARLAGDVVGDLRRSGEPLLAEVFTVIDRHHGEPLSLRDVARELGMTPGHLTTVVRRRTGRTVQEWIIERRMAEARNLLADTDLPVGRGGPAGRHVRSRDTSAGSSGAPTALHRATGARDPTDVSVGKRSRQSEPSEHVVVEAGQGA